MTTHVKRQLYNIVGDFKLYSIQYMSMLCSWQFFVPFLGRLSD